MFDVASFGISLLALVVGILAFIFGDRKSAWRVPLGIGCLVLALVFGATGFRSLVIGRATPTPTTTPTPTATGTIEPPTPMPTVTPSATLAATITPPAPITDPFCERPANAVLTYPQNGTQISGTVEIRGKLETRGKGGKWYSLYYHEGVTKQPMNEETHWLVPRPNWNNDPANHLIQYREFPLNQNPGQDSVLGKWDTSRLPTGWYTLRVWFEEVDAQFLACDVYVLVAR